MAHFTYVQHPLVEQKAQQTAQHNAQKAPLPDEAVREQRVGHDPRFGPGFQRLIFDMIAGHCAVVVGGDGGLFTVGRMCHNAT